MFLIDKIEPLYFFISLFIGLFFTYMLTPSPDVIIKYPTPENAKHNIYKDDADNCFKYRTEEVKCPNDKKLINEIPVQQKQKPDQN